MNFSLKNVFFPSVAIETTSIEANITQDLNFHIEVDYEINKEDSRKFLNIFNISLSNENYSCSVTAVAAFESDECIDVENQVHLKFININTPAIAFPFVRTFIANTMLNSGYIPVILQSINFVELNRNSKTQS